MDCTNKIDDLRIVRGNSFGLRITVKACRMDGTPITDFSLADAEATLNVLHSGTTTEKAFVVEDNDAIINFDATLGLGWYGLEMSGTYDGEEWRWCMERVWQMVETNERANVPSWAFLTGDTYMISGIVVINAAGVVQADWAETDPTAPSFILNKPDLSIYATHTEVAAKYTKPATGIPYADLNAALQSQITSANESEVVGFRYAQGTITFYKALSDGTFGSTTYDATDIIVAHHHNVVLYDITNNLFYFPLSFSASDVIRRYKYFRLDSSMTFGFIELMRAGSTPITSAYVAANVPMYTKAQVDALLATINQALDTIEAVIPSQASSANKLTDKNYVDGAIATNTANFVGTFETLAELQAVQNPTKNDYGFVIETDAQGNEYYDRYKYTGTQWLFEYKVESTPFTADQWAAIQSGITAALVTKLSALPTAAEITTALAGKQDTIADLDSIRSGAAAGAAAYQKPANGIPATDMTSSVQSALTRAESAVTSTDVTTIVKLTQAAYDAIATKDANTLYIIVSA